MKSARWRLGATSVFPSPFANRKRLEKKHTIKKKEGCVTAELWFVFAALIAYVFIPSKLKKIFWVNLGILIPMLGWMLYSQITSGYSLSRLGVRLDDPFAGWLLIAFFSLVAAVIMFTYASHKDTLTWNRNMTIALFLYPLWGCVQQFLILSFLNVRLMELNWSMGTIAFITAAAFMFIHYPDKWLMPATLAMGFIFSIMFQIEPNIWTLGASHGWLGILYYNWVIGKDPFAEKFGPKPKGDGML